MTFKKYVGKKFIFALFTIAYGIGSFISVSLTGGLPFPWSEVIPILILVWFVIGMKHLIKYARAHHKPD